MTNILPMSLYVVLSVTIMAPPSIAAVLPKNVQFSDSILLFCSRNIAPPSEPRDLFSINVEFIIKISVCPEVAMTPPSTSHEFCSKIVFYFQRAVHHDANYSSIVCGIVVFE